MKQLDNWLRTLYDVSMTTTTKPAKCWAARVTWQPSIVGHAPLRHDNLVWASTAQAAYREAARAFRELFPAGAILNIDVKVAP